MSGSLVDDLLDPKWNTPCRLMLSALISRSHPLPACRGHYGWHASLRLAPVSVCHICFGVTPSGECSRAWAQRGLRDVAGVGFTVAMLLAELSFVSSVEAGIAKLAVMVASLIAVVVAALVLVPSSRRRVARQ